MEWIKCSDRLPDLYQWVLVTNSPKGTGEPRCINLFRLTDRNWESLSMIVESPTFSDIIGDLFYEDVTHWMPLPQPPKD